MHLVTRLGLGLSALVLTVASVSASSDLRPDPQPDRDPTWQTAMGITRLTGNLEAWLDQNADIVRRDRLPAIRFVSARRIALLAGVAGRVQGRVSGLYDEKSSTIYLLRSWHADNPYDVSVLLHELVHHRQAPHFYYCPGAQELVAYRLQDAWLRARGRTADVNWVAVVLQAGCTPKDIHPD